MSLWKNPSKINKFFKELNVNYTYERFFQFFDRFSRFGKFALLHTDIHKDKRYMFLRLFFVNVIDESCKQKFFCK